MSLLSCNFCVAEVHCAVHDVSRHSPVYDYRSVLGSNQPLSFKGTTYFAQTAVGTWWMLHPYSLWLAARPEAAAHERIAICIVCQAVSIIAARSNISTGQTECILSIAVTTQALQKCSPCDITSRNCHWVAQVHAMYKLVVHASTTYQYYI